LALRFALRELRGGLTGLRLLAVCLILGVSALAGVGSLASAINAGLAERGQFLLGGDVEARLSSRLATAQERARLDVEGKVSEVIRLRAMVGKVAATMAGAAGSQDRLLVELKAVDSGWPLYGQFRIVGGRLCSAGCIAPGTAVVAQVLADRLGLRTGDMLMVGSARLRVAGVTAQEPDAAGEAFGFGPGVLMARSDVPATGLMQPGAQFRALYRVRLPAGSDAVAVNKRLEASLPDTDFQFRDSSNGAPSTRRFVDRLGQFLTLVGLTALVVAGVGVAGGVSAYLGAKTRTIATLKTLGADTATIRAVYLWQIGLVALGAVAIGLVIGAATPWVVVRAAAASLPVPPVLTPQWAALVTAAAYGVLIALAFALWPLAQAAQMPAARLFRSITERRDRPTLGMMALIVGAGLAIAGITIWNATDRLFVLGFLVAALGLIGILWALAELVRWLAAHAPRPRGTLAKLALGNLHRPGAPTRQLIVALGLGLTLFATLAVIETNFTGQITRTLPDRAPTFFIIDIPNDGKGAFAAMVAQKAPGAALTIVPSLRGPITAVKGVPASQINAGPDVWILRGDRGLSYAADFPPNNTLVSGTWWPRDYAGPPLISIDDSAAKALGLVIGDTITVSVLGVEIAAKIANTRKIDWQSLDFNFAILFAPGALEAAPHGWMATLGVTPAQEPGVQAAFGQQFPTASVVRVKDVLGQVAELLGQLSAAIRAAASVTVAAGIAVLIGALAAGARARTYDAVLLKLLGATRGQVALATLAEYGLLALVVSGLALLLGGGAGWYVITQVFGLEWQPAWAPVVGTVLLGGAATVLLGLAGSWRALSSRPNVVLRDL
jgi:putative ABC transport system permease protein